MDWKYISMKSTRVHAYTPSHAHSFAGPFIWSALGLSWDQLGRLQLFPQRVRLLCHRPSPRPSPGRRPRVKTAHTFIPLPPTTPCCLPVSTQPYSSGRRQLNADPLWRGPRLPARYQVAWQLAVVKMKPAHRKWAWKEVLELHLHSLKKTWEAAERADVALLYTSTSFPRRIPDSWTEKLLLSIFADNTDT